MRVSEVAAEAVASIFVMCKHDVRTQRDFAAMDGIQVSYLANGAIFARGRGKIKVKISCKMIDLILLCVQILLDACVAARSADFIAKFVKRCNV